MIPTANTMTFTDAEIQLGREALMALVRSGKIDAVLFFAERVGGLRQQIQIEDVTDPSLGLTLDQIFLEYNRRQAINAECTVIPAETPVPTDAPVLQHEPQAVVADDAVVRDAAVQGPGTESHGETPLHDVASGDRASPDPDFHAAPVELLQIPSEQQPRTAHEILVDAIRMGVAEPIVGELPPPQRKNRKRR